MPKKKPQNLSNRIFSRVIEGDKREGIVNLEEEYIKYFSSEPEKDDIEFVKKFIFERINNIKIEPFPQPFYQSIHDDKNLVTWFHPKYDEYSESDPPNEAFFDVLKWVHECTGNEFLLACAAYFASINSKNIYITDKNEDGGIDLISINSLENEIPAIFFVQAKTIEKASGAVTRDALLKDIGKYHSLPQKEIYQQYIKPINRHMNGCSFVYVYISNRSFKDEARKEAYFGKSVLIDDIRLSYSISNKFSLDNVLKVGTRIKDDTNSDSFRFDLSYDIASKFRDVHLRN